MMEWKEKKGITEMACGEVGAHFRQTTMGTKEKIKSNILTLIILTTHPISAINIFLSYWGQSLLLFREMK